MTTKSAPEREHDHKGCCGTKGNGAQATEQQIREEKREKPGKSGGCCG